MSLDSAPQTIAPDFPRPLHRNAWLFPLLAALLALSLLPFTVPVARALPALFDKLPLEWVFGAAKQFAVGVTIVSACAIVWVLDPRRRQAVLVFIIAIGITTGTCHAVKQLAGRARPFTAVLLKEGKKDAEWGRGYAAKHPHSGYVAESRDQWLGFNPQRVQNSGHFDSFPSGHTNGAFLLASFLTALYPRLAWLWLSWAFACGLSRVAGRVHYIEDVLMGGALGWFLTFWVFSWQWPARLSAVMLQLLEAKSLPIKIRPSDLYPTPTEANSPRCNPLQVEQ